MSEEKPAADLEALRERIDRIDTRLLELLNERARIAMEVGIVKNRGGLPIYAPEREEALLRKLAASNAGPLPCRSIRAIYREIISASLALENGLRVLCAGRAGSPSHLAALSRFGSSVGYGFCARTAGLLAEIESGAADCGVVEIETGENGIVGETLDALVSSGSHVLAEIHLQIGDEQHSADRFFVVGRGPSRPSGHDRTLLALEIADRPGSLAAALHPFAEAGIGLHHFASRPIGGDGGTLLFFAEADGHPDSDGFLAKIESFAAGCSSIRVLGSFPVGPDADD